MCAIAHSFRLEVIEGGMSNPAPIVPSKESALSVTIWGARGSFPISNSEGFGGRTSCYEVRGPDGFVLVDGGTGIIAAGQAIEVQSGDELHILLTHLHFDHVQGLPFFKPAFVKGVTIHLHLAGGPESGLEQALDTLIGPPFFPVRLDAFPARFVCHDLSIGEPFSLQGMSITSHELNHPGGAAGYRFERDGCSTVLLVDIEHVDKTICEHLAHFCMNADLVLHDTMVDTSEAEGMKGWGHSTGLAALSLASKSRIGRVIGIHHSPFHSDATLLDIERRLQALSPDFRLAREGDVFGVKPAQTRRLTRSIPSTRASSLRNEPIASEPMALTRSEVAATTTSSSG